MSFSDLNLNPKLLESIRRMGFSEPTMIQEKCIPVIKHGKDLVGQSLTGSGKTAAFGLPILEKIVPGNGLQALVLTPTRELCVQVKEHLEQMSRFLPINIISIYGGVGFYDQIEGIKIAEVVVATPGRLLDHLGRRNIDLKTIKFVVLDEADKMFEMGFAEDVDEILRHTPNNRQTVMFSATMPKAAQLIIKKYLKNPVFVQEKLHVDKSLLKQVFYDVDRNEKFSLLVHLLRQKTPGPAIVFCGTKREVDRVARNLKREKIDALPVHGDLSQGKRQFAVGSFKKQKIDVLVATDVAARGLDIKDVTHVYNYDVPRTPEEYTHRIGRTARAGKKGDAVTLLSERDYKNFDKILKQGKMQIFQENLPPFERIYPRQDFFHSTRERGYFAGEHQRLHRRQGERRNNVHQINRGYSSDMPQRVGRNFGAGNERRHVVQKDFGHGGGRHHSVQKDFIRGNEKRLNKNENPFGGNYEKTPRKREPLFPSSHYNPEYHKYEDKKHRHGKGH